MDKSKLGFAELGFAELGCGQLDEFKLGLVELGQRLLGRVAQPAILYRMARQSFDGCLVA